MDTQDTGAYSLKVSHRSGLVRFDYGLSLSRAASLMSEIMATGLYRPGCNPGSGVPVCHASIRQHTPPYQTENYQTILTYARPNGEAHQ